MGRLPGKGWQFLPCELTSNSGEVLRSIVLRYTTERGVGAGFAEWMAVEKLFFNTLVDRIVNWASRPVCGDPQDGVGLLAPCRGRTWTTLPTQCCAALPTPCLQHRWHDICLNGLSNFRGRNLNRFLALADRFVAPPPILSQSLAAWMVFYLGRFPGADR